MRTFALSLLALCSPVRAFVPLSAPRHLSGTSASLTRPIATRRSSNLPLRMVSNDGKNGWDVFTSEVAKKFAVAAAVASIAFSVPGDALAARSGGRLGGRSFSSPSPRMSSPSRSYAPSRSYGGGGVNVMPVPVPMGGGYGFGSPFGFSPFGSPFGYSPFGSPGVAFYGGGWGVSPVDLLILGGLAYGVTQFVKGGRTSFGDLDDTFSSLGEGVDVVKLQVALNCRDRSRSSILGVLADLSEREDTETRQGLASLVSEIGLALARRQVDWIASASQLEHFNNRNAERAEATFNQYTVQVRSKIERETNSVFGGRVMSSERSQGRGEAGGPTVAVVSLVLALRGEELKRLGLDRSVSNLSGLRSALETLAASALTDGGENVLAAEVLWTPEEPWETITREEAIEDFPQLMDI